VIAYAVALLGSVAIVAGCVALLVYAKLHEDP
jgi:hypothetical protein